MLNALSSEEAVIVVMVFLKVSCHGVVSVVGSYGIFVLTETVFESALGASNVEAGNWTWT